MPRALVVVANGFTDSEYTYAHDRCCEEDIEVHVATLDGQDAIGEKGWKAAADLSTKHAYEAALGFKTLMDRDNHFVFGLWDILLLPGGVKSIEKVRLDRPVIDIIKLHSIADRVIGSMCHGAQLLIEAGLVRNRNISGYYSIKTDIINAGGVYTDKPVRDGNIVSAPHYKFNGKWMRAVLELWRWKNGTSKEPESAASPSKDLPLSTLS